MKHPIRWIGVTVAVLGCIAVQLGMHDTALICFGAFAMTIAASAFTPGI